MAQPLLQLDVRRDLVDRHVPGALDHDLHAGVPGAFGELAQLDHLGGLHGIVGVVEATRAAGVAERDGHVVLVADFEDLIVELVEGVLVAGDLHPAKEQAATAAHDVHEAAGLLEGLHHRAVDARVHGDEVHAVLGMHAQDLEQVLGGEFDQRFLHVADGVVHGHGTHHERTLVDHLLAEGTGLAGVGEVHDGIGAAVDGDADLLPLLGCVGLVARDAEVDVDFGGEALAHAARGEAALDMADICRDGNGPPGHAFADVLGVAPLVLGHGAHLRGDLARAGEVHLRDGLVRRIAGGVDGAHALAPFVGITHIRFFGSGRAPPPLSLPSRPAGSP